MTIRTSLAAALIALAAAPVALAAPPWSEPQTLSSPHLFVDDPRVVLSGDGRALATWSWQDGVGEDSAFATDGASRPPGAAAFGAERRIGPSAIGPVAYGPSRAVLATLRGDRRQLRFRIAARFGTTAGAFGRPRAIARRRLQVSNVRIAANAGGLVAVAWFENRGVATDRVYVALRRPGRGFGRPIRLATGAIRRTGVAVGARGQVLVAWGDSVGHVHTRLKPARRQRFRRDDRIGARRAFGPDLRAAVTGRGRAVLAFSSQFTSEGGEPGPMRYQVAVKPAGERRFGDAQLLEQRPALGPGPGPALVTHAGGRSVVAWTTSDGANTRVRAATATGRSFGAPQTISPPGVDALAGDLAGGPGGQALAVWTVGDVLDEEGGQIQAALAPPGAAFGPFEAVSAFEEARVPAAAYDPVTGLPTVVWSNRPAGSARPLDEIETVAQAATRPG